MRPIATALLGITLASLARPQASRLPGWEPVWSDESSYTVNPLENARVDGHNLLIELREETL